MEGTFNRGIYIELSILACCSKKKNHDLRVFTEILALESITSVSYSPRLKPLIRRNKSEA